MQKEGHGDFLPVALPSAPRDPPCDARGHEGPQVPIATCLLATREAGASPSPIPDSAAESLVPSRAPSPVACSTVPPGDSSAHVSGPEEPSSPLSEAAKQFLSSPVPPVPAFVARSLAPPLAVPQLPLASAPWDMEATSPHRPVPRPAGNLSSFPGEDVDMFCFHLGGDPGLLALRAGDAAQFAHPTVLSGDPGLQYPPDSLPNPLQTEYALVPWSPPARNCYPAIGPLTLLVPDSEGPSGGQPLLRRSKDPRLNDPRFSRSAGMSVPPPSPGEASVANAVDQPCHEAHVAQEEPVSTTGKRKRGTSSLRSTGKRKRGRAAVLPVSGYVKLVDGRAITVEAADVAGPLTVAKDGRQYPTEYAPPPPKKRVLA